MTDALGYVVLGRTGPGEDWFVDDDPELIEKVDVAVRVLARTHEDAADPDGLTYGYEHQLAAVVPFRQWHQYKAVVDTTLALRNACRALTREASKPVKNQTAPLTEADATEQEQLRNALTAARNALIEAVDAIDSEVKRA